MTTKMLEGGTGDEMRMFDGLFKVVSTLVGPITIEKSIEHPHLLFRLPTSSFGEHKARKMTTKDSGRM